ncbi:MAG TPA: DNA ligase [Rhodocyclaceae bacterium]|jgi:DNA ligase-1
MMGITRWQGKWRALFLAAGLLIGLNSMALAEDPVPPALLLAETYQPTKALPISAYWVSEKLDGVRAVWDGHVLRYRSGRLVPAPAWFVAALPAEPLDGELWLGRDRFDELSAIVRKTQPVDQEWRQVQYMVFDQPDGEGDFTTRLAHLKQLLGSQSASFVQVIEQFRLPDAKALKARLQAVVHAGGEGLMLHRADALYRAGRSDDLLKLKPWQDAEARVVAIVPGRGRLAGVMGALLVETTDGKRFRLGSGFSDRDRHAPPQIGAQVTYRYTSLTPKGLPRFPRYWRVRESF